MNKKEPIKNKTNKKPKFGGQIVTAILIFMFITALYSILAEPKTDTKNFTIELTPDLYDPKF